MHPREALRRVGQLSGALLLRDYFHQPQPLGLHWQDERCYYNDLRRKAIWSGASRNGVPLLRVPAMDGYLEFPIMILQYGLGSLDCYFTSLDETYLLHVDAVHDWMLGALETRDAFDNHFPLLDPAHQYASGNSAMAQGQALSLATRLVRYFPERYAGEALLDVMRRVSANMVRPVAQGGTLVERDEGPALVESCRGDGHLVFNGWMFALFGLYDCANLLRSTDAGRQFDDSEQALARFVPRMVLYDGWSVYDEEGNLASPFYQELHVALLEAMFRLTNRRVYHDAATMLRTRGSRWWVRGRRITEKVIQKLGDRRLSSGV